MRLFALPFLAAALTFTLAADDSTKTKTKYDATDPVTGERVKAKTKVKSESDGDFKVDAKTQIKGPAGKSKSKLKVRGDSDGVYKEQVKTKTK